MGKDIRRSPFSLLDHHHAENDRSCVFYGDLYPNRECDTATIAPTLRKLIEARKMHAYGPVKDYLHDRNCIGFVRSGGKGQGTCVVAISNADKKTNAQ